MAHIVIKQVRFHENHSSGKTDIIRSIDFSIRNDDKTFFIKKRTCVLDPYDSDNYIEYSNIDDATLSQWVIDILTSIKLDEEHNLWHSLENQVERMITP